MRAFKCRACRALLRLGSKYCHACGFEINRVEYGNYLSDLFEERQYAAYRLLPKKLKKEGYSVKGCKHIIHQYRWRLGDISAVLESITKHHFSFLRLDIGICFEETGPLAHSWTHVKPNPRIDNESWSGFVLRTSGEAQQCIQELIKLVSTFGGPISALGTPIGVLAFCDEFLFEDWPKYRTGFIKEYRGDLPRSGQLIWWSEPISIREIQRSIAETYVDNPLIRGLEVIQKYGINRPRNFRAA
jgi:hypothetical protein